MCFVYEDVTSKNKAVEMNSRAIIIFVFFVLINGVKCDENCKSYNEPCVCESYDVTNICLSTETQILEHLNTSLHVPYEQIVTWITYYNLESLPPLRTLKKFNSLKVISIVNGKAKRIDQFAFDGLALLLRLRLSGTNITTIEAKAFHSLPSLGEINLSRNKIREINENSFYDLPQLENLNLEFNEITEIRDGTFSKLVKLVELKLRRNPLKVLQQQLFGSNINNFLTDDGFLAYTTDNMECGCDMIWLIEIYKNTKSLYKNEFLEQNKCWLAWNREGLLNLDAGDRCLKLQKANATK